MAGQYTPVRMFYRQWSNMGATQEIFGESKSITEIDSLIKGHPELPMFFDEVFATNDNIRQQFADVSFAGSNSLENRLLQLFDQNDMRVSLFNATNMRQLFELGGRVEIDPSTGQYEVARLQPLVDEMEGEISSLELYLVYAYLKNLIHETYLNAGRKETTFDKVSMAFTLSDVVRNEFQRFRANFTSKVIAASALKFLALDDCLTSWSRLFPRLRGNAY